MNIVILSLIETLGICMVGLMFFVAILFIPTEGIKVKKNLKLDLRGSA